MEYNTCGGYQPSWNQVPCQTSAPVWNQVPCQPAMILPAEIEEGGRKPSCCFILTLFILLAVICSCISGDSDDDDCECECMCDCC